MRESDDRQSPALSSNGSPAFLAGGGELGALIRGYDWRRTPLGVPQDWPQALQIATGIMLASRQPIWIGWGDELTFFYNDPYKAIIGGKHPVALGRPTRVVWREIWDEIAPLLDTALNGSQGTFVEQKLLVMERNGFPEETYYTFSYSPIPGPDGRTGGIICANSDDTARVVGERQLALLRELAASTADTRSVQDACKRSTHALAANARDIPFAALYLANGDDTRLKLAATVGIEPGHAAAPATLALGPDSVWPAADALRSLTPRFVDDLRDRFGADLPSGPWHLRPTRAMILPVLAGGEATRPGVLIVALNPCRLLDENYRAFLDLVAGQIGAAIGYAIAYEAERERAEALAELDRAKTTFFSNISHEFRTPLTLMLGPLEELLAKSAAREQPAGADEDGTRALIEITHRNGLRLLKLVNALLDFSRIEAGRFQLDPKPTDLAAFTAELASLFQSAIESAGMHLRIERDAAPLVVTVDRDMWEKVVMNLLSNAFKFTLEGSIVVRVAASADGGVTMSVTDTGIGVPADEVPRLFERFHRVAGAAGRSVEGSGIGLAMVQELVKLHGGTVEVDSEPGRGTCFTVNLPAITRLGHAAHAAHAALVESVPDMHASMSPYARSYVETAMRWTADSELDAPPPLEEPDALRAIAANGTAATGHDEPAHLLIVDDNADLREYMRRILTAAGHRVSEAGNGELALESARAEPPDLILSDVMMPRLDGFGLLRAIREDHALRETPVLLLSARAGEEATVGGIQSGADDYLTKPFSARELLARVAGNLQLARLRRETEQKLRDESRTLEILNRVGTTVAGELDLNRAVQVVTDAATELTGAAFGAFFYNVIDESNGKYMLYTLSGVPKDSFAQFPMPRNTAVFGPTFDGAGIVRSDDITQDPRYGKNAPHTGMPHGHLPVRSYLAAPVVSRTGEVLGGLFFGHPERGIFSERAERILTGIAAQASVAIDNARLYQGAQNEIAERARAQTALAELNATLEQRVTEMVADRDRLWQLSDDLLVIADFDGNLVRVSPSWTRILGRDEASLLARSYNALIHPDDLDRVRDALAELRLTGRSVRFENRAQRADGSWRWIAWTLSLDPLKNWMHGVGRDVTADRDTAEALRHAEEALRMAQKMEAIGKLTGGVAHDFNNLLQVIGGNLQLLAKDVAGLDKPEQRVRNALAGVARGANLASQLLAFGRRQPLAPKVVNLGRFVRGLDDMLRRALGDGVEIETIVSGGLWNTLVDPFQVENALLNLAINARDAMKGHGKLTIEAGNASLDDGYAHRNLDVTPGQYVMLAVTDTGSGMTPDVVERVFEPFFTTKPEGQGTGLGLSMVYGFVKQSGGHVKIYSEPGHGTTIRLYLPRERGEEDLETSLDAGPAAGGTETILVVEDDEEVRATVVDMLLDLGYRVLKAKDAQSALAIVESGVPIDMLFTDVVMPGALRSPELARKARERLPSIAVLFTSGYTDNAIVHAGRLDEGIELLSKPYTHEALARKVRHVLRINQPEPSVAATQLMEELQAAIAPSAGDSAADSPLVLYLEDDELIRTSTAELLRAFGFDVLEAERETDALALLAARPIDVLLSDVGLPGRSGVDVAIDACRAHPQLKVIFLSGYNLELTREQQAALPHARHLRKPYDPLELVEMLRPSAA